MNADPTHGLTALANRDELRFREQVQPLTDTPDVLVRKIEASGRLKLLPYLIAQRLVEPSGTILEIGAGTGWLSCQLSQLPRVTQVVATDFSPRLVNEVMPVAADRLHADPSRLVRQVADFHRLPFESGTFDWVFADSALHHASDIVTVLREVRRVLKAGGRLIALREPVRALVPYWQLRARRDTVDALATSGVPEPLFSRREWRRFFADAGLDLRWHDVSFSHGARRFVSIWLNGVVKADYCMVGTAKP